MALLTALVPPVPLADLLSARLRPVPVLTSAVFQPAAVAGPVYRPADGVRYSGPLYASAGPAVFSAVASGTGDAAASKARLYSTALHTPPVVTVAAGGDAVGGRIVYSQPWTGGGGGLGPAGAGLRGGLRGAVLSDTVVSTRSLALPSPQPSSVPSPANGGAGNGILGPAAAAAAAVSGGTGGGSAKEFGGQRPMASPAAAAAAAAVAAATAHAGESL